MRASARTQATKRREGTDPVRGKAKLPQSASPMQRSTIRSRRTLGKGCQAHAPSCHRLSGVDAWEAGMALVSWLAQLSFRA